MMSQARFQSLYSGLTIVAKKVYEAVPKQEAWSIHQIQTELRRMNKNIETRIVSGCLNSLIRAGLITEDRAGNFQREEVKTATPIEQPQEKAPDMKPTPTATVSPAPAQPKAVSPIDRLEALAKRANELSAQVKKFADEIGDAAIDIQTQLEQSEQNVAKLRQLQTLLRSIGEAEAA